MALPWIVVLQSRAFGYPFPESISATYFVDSCITPFMIILGSAGILLLNYSGYDKVDDILNTAAGIFGLGVCLFPTWAPEERIGTFLLDPDLSSMIHLICAICFFGILAYNSLFQFTKGSDNPTPNKKKRNVIFRVCGVGMIASFIALIPFNIFHIPYAIWIIETVALFFFGISWLTKANRYYWLFADKE